MRFPCGLQFFFSPLFTYRAACKRKPYTAKKAIPRLCRVGLTFQTFASEHIKKTALRSESQRSQTLCSCWGTRTRTRKGRTRICSVTITPYPKLGSRCRHRPRHSASRLRKLGYPDSNQERQDQNLQCYHYTIPQSREVGALSSKTRVQK